MSMVNMNRTDPFRQERASRAVHPFLAFALLLLSTCASAVSLRADFASALDTPFPSNWFTVPDHEQITGMRVAMPMPDCATRVSDCRDLAVINSLDGFNVEPRITIPFTTPIDLSTVSNDTVFLTRVAVKAAAGAPQRVGLNQLQWDEISLTLIGAPDEILAQHAMYLLVVTDGIKGENGDLIDSERFWKDLERTRNDESHRAYIAALKAAVRTQGFQKSHIVAASLFTTQSVTVGLEKMRDLVRRGNPKPIDFKIGVEVGSPGSGQSKRLVQAVFSADAMKRMVFHRQTGTGSAAGPQFEDSDVPIGLLELTPGAVHKVAFGRFASPDFETPGGYIPAAPTRTGAPSPVRRAQLVVEIFFPAGRKPKAGWPVAIFGHGLGDSIFGGPWAIASQLAAQGIATAAINSVGQGGGERGSIDVIDRKSHVVTVSAGGRGIDQDNDGQIGAFEGLYAMQPRSIVSGRDGKRQTIVDMMQLAREIQVGVDIGGNGGRDLDPARIYYVGHSQGAILGTTLLALDPSIRAGVLVAAGGPNVDIYRLGTLRQILGKDLGNRIPSLLNPAVPEDPAKPSHSFVDNIPLRNQPITTSAVPGAMAIQQVIENMRWVAQLVDPVAFAPYLRAAPLPGNAAKRVLLIVAKGDRTVPNPTSTAIIRNGNLADCTTLYRADLAYAANPTVMPNNPHDFFDDVDSAEKPFALAAQRQIAVFLKTDGKSIVHSEGDSPIFETPIVGPLPEGVDFFP